MIPVEDGIAIIKSMMRLIKRYTGRKRTLKYNDVFEACEKIYEQILDDKKNFYPDYILGIDGGGCVVAAILQQHLNKPLIQFAANRDGNDSPIFPKEEYFFKEIKPLIENKNVLLVDDLSNGSRTLKRASDKLKENGAEVKIAVISKPSITIANNQAQDLSLYCYSVKEWDHDGKCTIFFPWDVWGDDCPRRIK